MSNEKITKGQITFSLNKGLAELFNNYCFDNHINKSALLEDMVRTYMRENSKGFNDSNVE